MDDFGGDAEIGCSEEEIGVGCRAAVRADHGQWALG